MKSEESKGDTSPGRLSASQKTLLLNLIACGVATTGLIITVWEAHRQNESFVLIVMPIVVVVITVLLMALLYLLRPDAVEKLLQSLARMECEVSLGSKGSSPEKIYIMAKAIARLAERAKGDKTDKTGPRNDEIKAEQVKANTAIAALLNERRSALSVASVVLVLALGVYLAIGFFTGTPPSTVIISLLAAAVVLINAAAISLNYRVSHGLYGTNEYEAREIIQFVLAHAEEIDLSGGLGATDWDLSPETERILASLWEGETA